MYLFTQSRSTDRHLPTYLLTISVRPLEHQFDARTSSVKQWFTDAVCLPDARDWWALQVRDRNVNKYRMSRCPANRSASWCCSCATNWTRNSSGDEIANVNFLYDDIVHVLQNTMHKFRHRSTLLRWNAYFTKFREITQCNGHYAVQGHSRSPILVPIESSYTTSY